MMRHSSNPVVAAAKRLSMFAVVFAVVWISGCDRESPAPPPLEMKDAPPTVAKVEPAKMDPAERAKLVAAMNSELERLVGEAEAELNIEPPKPAINAEKQGAAPPPDAAKAPEPKQKQKTFKELIVGKWEMTMGEQNITMEFKEGGKVALSASGHDLEGEYSWDSDTALKITMTMELPDGQTHTQSQTVTVKALDDWSMTLVRKMGDTEQEHKMSRVN